MNSLNPATLTIIMYHYVRDVRKTNFPGIHALSVDDFSRQIEKLQSVYEMIAPHDLLEWPKRKGAVRPACLLSFDDGLADHYHNVLPILEKHTIRALFFPITISLEGKVADVNKIQFLLAGVGIDTLVEYFHEFLRHEESGLREKFLISDKEKIDSRYRFDDVRTANLKVTLQTMPYEARKKFLNLAFQKYIGNEAVFAKNLYLNNSQIKEIRAHDHIIGSHTHTHPRFDRLSRDEQYEELRNSKMILESVLGGPISAISYPHGSYNEVTVEIARDLGYTVGLGTEVGVNETNFNQWSLKRINANDVK